MTIYVINSYVAINSVNYQYEGKFLLFSLICYATTIIKFKVITIPYIVFHRSIIFQISHLLQFLSDLKRKTTQ